MSIDGNYINEDIRSEFLEPSPTFVSAQRMLFLINKAQNDYVRRTRVLQSFAFTSTVAGQNNYPLPTDWLGSEKVFYNNVFGNLPNWRPLSSTNMEKLAQETPNFLSNDPSTFGYPTKNYVIGKTLYLFATPLNSGVNDLFLFYESKPTQLLSLNDTLSVDDSLYDGIRAYILWKLWKADNEDTKAAEEKANYFLEIGQGFKWKNKRILDGKWKIDIESFLPYTFTTNASGAINGQMNPLNQ